MGQAEAIIRNMAESAIQGLLRDNPVLTRAEVVEMLDAHGFLDKRLYLPI
jgi:hypothetical protein